MTLKLRQPAVAGQFYPADARELQEMLSNFLGQLQQAGKDYFPRIIIVPHAGYIFSGPVAAYAYQVVKQADFKRIIILGVSHYYPFNGIALSGCQLWETPLGTIKVDQQTNQSFLKVGTKAFINDDIHRPEHSLEVQLPFLQYCLSDFVIVPLLLGGEDKTTLDFLSGKLSGLLASHDVLLVVSSDLSHYPDYNTATEADKRLLGAVVKGRYDEFISVYQQLEKEFPYVDTFACGRAAILTALQIAEIMKLKGELLHYANSGDSPWGDKERVVGYGAVVFY